MSFRRVTSVRFALAGYLTVMGALILVAPHQFNYPEYNMLLNSTDLWGGIFILLGLTIFGLSVFRAQRILDAGIYAITATLFLVLAAGFNRAGFWIWALNHCIFGLAALFLVFIPEIRKPGAGSSGARREMDLLAWMIGILGICTGLLFLFTRQGFTDPRYDLIRPYFWLIGVVWLISGVIMIVPQMLGARAALPKRAAYAFTGGLLLFYCALVPMRVGIWPQILFYGGMGILLLLIAWVQRPFQRLDPSLLQARLAILLTITMAAPLTTTVALISKLEEDAVTREVLERQRSEAAVLAEVTAQYIGLHRSALHLLASEEGLLALDTQALEPMLRRYANTYPDVIAFSIFDATGAPIARSDDVEAVSLSGHLVFENAENTLQPGVVVYYSPIYNRQVFAFYEPLFDDTGAFHGMVMISMDSAQINAFLKQSTSQGEQIVYMVDAAGKVISHPDPGLVAATTDLSAQEPVRALINAPGTDGSLLTGPAYNQTLVGYARVRTVQWDVIVERPSSAALSSVHTGRDIAFLILLGFILIITIIAAVIAEWVSRPLKELDEAAIALASGNNRMPIPRSGITEIERLATSFGQMRQRLQQRTAEREHAEKALIEANEQLEERVAQRTADLEASTQALIRSNRELQDFAYITSHDLQEPLRKIQAFGDRLRGQAQGSLSPEAEDSLDRMQNAAVRMQKMIEDLLTYARVTTKAIVPVQTELEPILAEVISDLEVRIQQTGARFEVDPLPRLYADPTHMRQLFQNLLGNALKFHRPGVPPVVRVYCDCTQDGYLNLIIEDNGIGFDPQYAERVFQPFQRLHSRETYEGNGIGLAICRKILETNGGTIKAQATPGQGTRFIMTFPLITQSPQEGARP